MKSFFVGFSNRQRWFTASATVLVALLSLLYFFPWDALRGPINRYVSAQIGRRFEITRHLDVHLGFTTTVRADGIEIANPEWAQEPYLLRANSAEIDVRIFPLLVGKVILPRVALSKPSIGLQIEPDGRRTWSLAKNTSKPGLAPAIGDVAVDNGALSYFSKTQGADLRVEFSVAEQANNLLPLQFSASGKWNNSKFSASGRSGSVLKFSQQTQAPFPLDFSATAGRTSLKAKGTVASLAELGGIDATFDLKGQNLDDLYGLLGVVLPSTPPYSLRGKLDKNGRVWAVSQLQGVLGKSDLSGNLSFDQSAKVPRLTGKVQSRTMDFADLAPIIGITPAGGAAPNVTKPGGRAVTTKAAPAATKAEAATAPISGKVLPVTQLDVAKLKAMNADVTYSAADIRHVKELPLDKGSVHVLLKDGVLQLDPITLGVAGGTIAGTIRVDSTVLPAAFATRLNVRGVKLNELFPTVKSTKTGLGTIGGKFDLKGTGNSVAQMLASASGDAAVLMGKGEISNILLEFMGLDGGEIIKFLVRGDRTVQLRCAAAAFDVKKGLMTSRAIVLDTSDTVIAGQGQISLANETLDILLKPEPKDMSILSLRSPLRIGGTFSKMTAGPEKSALAGRAGIALLLGAINPLLALAATIETGPGVDADCAEVLKLAAQAPAGSKPVAAIAKPPSK